MNQKDIGKFIAFLRKENHMTQEQLAEKMGVTDKSVSRWENGKTLPDISLLIPLSELLNISLRELLKGRRLNKDELIHEKEMIEELIQYDVNRRYDYHTKAMTKLGIGLFITSIAILNNYYPFLEWIFTPNIAEFVQGFMYGVGIALELISSYNLTHEISFQERKKQLIKKARK